MPFIEYALPAAALALGLPALKRRLDLSRAKHRSLAGHSRLAKRLARLLPGYAYDEARFFNCDGVSDEAAQLRRALELVAEMRSRGISCNTHTYSALMNVCIKVRGARCEVIDQVSQQAWWARSRQLARVCACRCSASRSAQVRGIGIDQLRQPLIEQAPDVAHLCRRAPLQRHDPLETDRVLAIGAVPQPRRPPGARGGG